MTAPYASDEKRSDLVRAAKELLRERGFARTTLSLVAKRAGVPLGNVYYYFKTKEALAEAVIESHATFLRELFASWVARYRDPRLALHALIRVPLDSPDSIIEFGCPYGSLCQEFAKLGQEAPLAKAGRRLLTVYIDWAEEQFRALAYRGHQARALAADLVAAIMGTILVAHTMSSPEMLAEHLRRVESWLDATISDHSSRSR